MTKHRLSIMALMVILGLAIIGAITVTIDSAYGAEPEREWFSFMMDRTTCIEIKAVDFEHAQCVLEQVAEEEGYKLAQLLDDGCPGMLAENYYYDFTFKECLD